MRPSAAAGASRRRRWLFRLLSATIVPLLVFAALELGLRAIGYGHATQFLVAVPGQSAYATNRRFGWRFFPREIARAPVPQRLDREKDPAAYRIFLLGGSAALGTPDSSFGMAEILELMLRERYPGTRFEIVNAAMTAINSHVVREIARECAHHQPDLFLVYLGNNEVVGPYGPGTVFRRFSPSLGLIRLSIRAGSLRTGQLVGRWIDRLGTQRRTEWEGMEMFREQRVREDDTRLERVYSHLEANLDDVVELARGAGAEIILSTVAVNLKDSAPFASLHRSGLRNDERERFRADLRRAEEKQRVGELEAALEEVEAAARIDEDYADVWFRRGRLAWLQGSATEAERSFRRALELDALRFRADSGINETIRRVAVRHSAQLVEAEQALVAEGGGMLPGNELFWEHVHLRFRGNYLVARMFLRALEPLLPERVARRRVRGLSIPDATRCAELLALSTDDRARMAREIRDMMKRPPFLDRSGHEATLAARHREFLEWRARSRLEGDQATHRLRAAVEREPGNAGLRARLAERLFESGAIAEAIEQWRAVTRRLPGVPEWHTRLGFALAEAGGLAEAEAELRGVLELEDGSAASLVNLGNLLERGGRLQEAERSYGQALTRAPLDLSARFNLALLHEKRGALERGVDLLTDLVELEPDSAAGHRRLAELLDRAGRTQAAELHYRRALALDPDPVAVRNNLGVLLEREQRFDEAVTEYSRAIERDPEFSSARFNLGDVLLTTGRVEEAIRHYRRGLELEPGRLQARINLGTALMAAGRSGEARQAFQAALVLARERGEAAQVAGLERRLEQLGRTSGPDPSI